MAEEGIGQGEWGRRIAESGCFIKADEASFECSGMLCRDARLLNRGLPVIQSCQLKVNRHLGEPCMMVCERCMDRQGL